MFLFVTNLQPLPGHQVIAKGETALRRYANIGNRTAPVDQVQPVDQRQGGEARAARGEAAQPRLS